MTRTQWIDIDKETINASRSIERARDCPRPKAEADLSQAPDLDADAEMELGVEKSHHEHLPQPALTTSSIL
jgi:hypothetical protein